MKTPILGSAYVARSVNAADNRMVNLFPEVVPEGGKEAAFLLRAPGIRYLTTIGSGPIRGMWWHGEYAYVVSGYDFYKVDSSYNATYIGQILNEGPISMTDNGFVIFIAANGLGYQYLISGETISFTASISGTTMTVTSVSVGKIYEGMEVFGAGVLSGTTVVSQTSGTTGGVGVYEVSIAQSISSTTLTGPAAFQQITSTDFAGANIVSYLNGYFIYVEPNSQRFYYTYTFDIGEGTITPIFPLTFDAGNVFSAEGSPDNLVSMIVDHGELWLFGENSVEVWYQSGSNQIFDRIQGAFNELGCAAAFSVAKMDNGLFWLGADARGRGLVYRANGYRGERISTHAVEYAIAQYGDISDAIAYTYQQEGHSFYVLTFPSANATWVYDVATTAWHERAAWATNHFVRHRSNCQLSFNDEIIVGDYQNGNLYAFDLDTYADNGEVQRWLRSWRALPTGQNTLVRTAHHTLQLDCEGGIGNTPFDLETYFFITAEDGSFLATESDDLFITSGQYNLGSDPQVMLRWSDDGGHTWSNEHWSKIGRTGQYFTRVLWRRLGMTTKIRDRVYEVSGSDPVKIAIVGAELKANETTA